MPFCQDDDSHIWPSPFEKSSLKHKYITPNLTTRPSSESLQTELCDGPLYDVPVKPDAGPDDAATQTNSHDAPEQVTDRQELIERIKRGESPTWRPKHYTEDSLYASQSKRISRESSPASRRNSLFLQLPATDEYSGQADISSEQQLKDGLAIERPRSALHSGNFAEDIKDETKAENTDSPDSTLRTNYDMPSPWLSTTPPRGYTQFRYDQSVTAPVPIHSGSRPATTAPSVSASISSSFVFMPPTSPLVQSETQDDVSDDEGALSRNPRRNSHQPISPSPSTPLGAYSGYQTPASLRTSHPYQAHQPRRSNGSLGRSVSGPDIFANIPPFLRTRRPSVSDGPLHASMVGSYEESILRGRMSTTPSKPLEFVAQIGVLGLGKCKPNLKCPPHVTLSFPAVFYSYATTSHGRSLKEDGPSPYVGSIDLENGVPHVKPSEKERERGEARKRRERSRTQALEEEMVDGHEFANAEKLVEHRKRRRSKSPRSPMGGSYRIPPKGQLQIIIKNPNKTAVKLFLVPYDLAGMEAGMKTFIRQRIFSTGPVTESPQSSDKAPNMLRYLIHLHICCPSKGRFYLHKSIRVVFANRVPDAKEKLQTEIQYAEPRYTPYKPERQTSLTGTTGWLKRRSATFGSVDEGDMMDGVLLTHSSAQFKATPYSAGSFNNGFEKPVEPIAFSFYRGEPTTASSDVSVMGSTSRPVTAAASSSSGESGSYGKLAKGENGYGALAFGSGKEITEGLLAKKLKGLSWDEINDNGAKEGGNDQDFSA